MTNKTEETTVANHYAIERRGSLFQRCVWWAFPSQHCFTPEAPPSYQDCIEVRSVTVLSWRDRLRVLLTGCVVTVTKTVTENTVGDTVTNAVCYPAVKRNELNS